MTNLTQNSFLCIYFNSLHVSSNLVLIIRRINCINTTSGIWPFRVQVSDLYTKRSPTRGDIYQRLYWYNWFSWWWARVCSKHVENWNKHIEYNCASSWSFTKNHNKMHGQQNIKLINAATVQSKISELSWRAGVGQLFRIGGHTTSLYRATRTYLLV
jgi:hypothetical protein